MQKHGYKLMEEIFSYFMLLCFLLYRPFVRIIDTYDPNRLEKLGSSINHYNVRLIIVFFVNLGIIYLRMLQFKKPKILKWFLNYYGLLVFVGTFIYPFFTKWMFGPNNRTDIYVIMGPLYIMLFLITISVDKNTFSLGKEEINEIKENIEKGIKVPDWTKNYFYNAYFMLCWHLFLFVILIFWLNIIGKVQDGYANTLVTPAFSTLLILIGIGVLYYGYHYIKNKGFLKGKRTKFFNRFNGGGVLLNGGSKSKTSKKEEGIFKKKNETTGGFWDRMYDEYNKRDKSETSKNKDEYITIKENNNSEKMNSDKLIKDNPIVVDSESIIGKKTKFEDEKNGEEVEDENEIDSDKNKKEIIKRIKGYLDDKVKNYLEHSIVGFIAPLVIALVISPLLYTIADKEYLIHILIIVLVGSLVLGGIIFLYTYFDNKKSKIILQNIKEGKMIFTKATITSFSTSLESYDEKDDKSRAERTSYTINLSDGENKYRINNIPYKWCDDIVYDENNEVFDNLKGLFYGRSKPVAFTYRGKRYKIGGKVLVMVTPGHPEWYFY